MGDLARLIEAVEAGTLDPQDDWDWLRDPFPMSPAEVAKGDYESDEVANIRGAFYGSLDAAKALHDALLSGWSVQMVGPTTDDEWMCNVGDEDSAFANTAARAWLLAILRALEAEGKA